MGQTGLMDATRTTPRERARAQTVADIIRIGRAHLARDGAAALSLRAVARDLGVVSSAVYRYVASRDDLLTLLVVDAYTELGDAVDAGLASARPGPRLQLLALARSMRGWALSEPAGWSLLYGSPVPGYAAPAEQTMEPGTRVMAALVRVLDDADAAGIVVADPATRLGRALRSDLRSMSTETGSSLSEPQLARALLWWSGIIGVISAEAFGQLGAETVTDPDALFEHHLEVLSRVLVEQTS